MLGIVNSEHTSQDFALLNSHCSGGEEQETHCQIISKIMETMKQDVMEGGSDATVHGLVRQDLSEEAASELLC